MVLNALEESFYMVPRENDFTQPSQSATSTLTTHVESHSKRNPIFVSPASPPLYTVHGRHILDASGRVSLLRGVNLSGSSKIPVNHDSANFPTGHNSVSFVGRPFPLEDGAEHAARLRRWGLTFVRLLVTWEALEHDGPGKYDTDYLNYLASLIQIMSPFGITFIVSMHQDVWSRYSGGSGAPAWTLEYVGFDLTKLEESGAAYLGGVKVPGEEKERGRWPTGYQKLASSTMWTCFFAGDIFAPKLKVENEKGQMVGIQTFLQETFLNSYEALVKAVGSLDGVLGFELLNEPHRGYISLPSLHSFDYNTDLHLHDTPSALQSFSLGAGHATSVPHYVRSFPFPTRLSHHVNRNEDSTNVWRRYGPTKGECLWEMHGVWGWDGSKQTAVGLRESYFTKRPDTGETVEWYVDCWYPLIKEWERRVNANTDGTKLLLLEPIPNEFCPSSWSKEHQPKNMVFAPHWYDLNALFTKTFGSMSVNVQGLSRGMFVLKALYWGQNGVRKNYTKQIQNIVQAAYSSLDERPVIIGECGIPIDMNNGEAFSTNNFVWQRRMMDAMLCALEQNMVGFTLWNYNPDNDDIAGDYWNGENFSWFSSSRARRTESTPPTSSPSTSKIYSQLDRTLDEGGRLLDVVVRPYPAKVAGTPLSFHYDVDTWAFDFAFNVSSPSSDLPLTTRETELFVPSMIADGRQMLVKLSCAGEWRYEEERQILVIIPSEMAGEGVVHVSVEFDPSPGLPGDLAGTSGVPLGLLIPILFAIVAYFLYWGV